MEDINLNQIAPFIGPRTFLEEERHLFFGREKEFQELLSLVLAHRLVLFYAQSGVGKSSLINTKLIPALRTQNFDVLPTARVNGEVDKVSFKISNVFSLNLLTSIDQQKTDLALLNNQTLVEYFQEDEADIGIESMRSNKAKFLIIDQFEEALTSHLSNWEQKESFFQQLGDLLFENENLWILLVMREDHIAGLDPYIGFFPEKLRVRFHMEKMGVEKAREVIIRPLKLANTVIDPEALELLVNDLRTSQEAKSSPIYLGQYIELVQLQIVCQKLWLSIPSDESKVTVEAIRKLGAVNSVLLDFYELTIKDTVNTFSEASELELRYWFEKVLIAPNRTRGLVQQEDQETGGLNNEIVEFLNRRLIINSIQRSNSNWYELTHDRFVEIVIESNQSWGERLKEPKINAWKWLLADKSPLNLVSKSLLKIFQEIYEKHDNPDPVVHQYLTESQWAIDNPNVDTDRATKLFDLSMRLANQISTLESDKDLLINSNSDLESSFKIEQNLNRKYRIKLLAFRFIFIVGIVVSTLFIWNQLPVYIGNVNAQRDAICEIENTSNQILQLQDSIYKDAINRLDQRNDSAEILLNNIEELEEEIELLKRVNQRSKLIVATMGTTKKVCD